MSEPASLEERPTKTPPSPAGFCFYNAWKKESAQIMNTAPSLILTRLDVQRLENLIDSQDDSTPGIQALQAELDRAEQVVGHDEVPEGVVTMNSRVHCREESSGKDYHLTLVYPKDAGVEGTVSVLAPMGSALLGLQVGQHIDWPAPGGKTLKLTLLAVEYQPEAAGEYQ
ncbi:Nucleoside diphosphate kinase regulator [Pseudomonas viridiflava]|nr:Nucleoside diphosphate kinase regulator [Pseudomonas viridiflava]